MAIGHLLDTFRASLGLGPPLWGGLDQASVGLAHLGVMDTTHITHTTRDALEPVFTITELATELSVSTQALYDQRSKGRGPTGFRVGRQLRFRQSEIDAWLARLGARTTIVTTPETRGDPRETPNRTRHVR